ncbi:MAG: LysR family transcriptional regulator [Thiolinea sp.]
MNRQAPLNWLRSFEAAARHNSFTQAAKELNLTQAAISKQIKALEHQLNCQLFKRQAHGLKLTEQGRRYWLDTHSLIEQLDKVTTQFYKRQQHQRIHIRSNISYSLLVLGQKLLPFREQHPDVEIELTHDIWEPDKRSDNAHIEIGYQLLTERQYDDHTCLLSRDRLFPVIAAQLPDSAVAQLPLIHVSGYYREWRWWCEQLEKQPAEKKINQNLIHIYKQHPKQAIHVDNSAVAYELAAQGLGIALGRSCLAEAKLHSGQLRRADTYCELDAQEGFVIRLTQIGQHNALAKTLFHSLRLTSGKQSSAANG